MIDNNMGLEKESQYGYTAREGSCKLQKSKELIFLQSWKAIGQDEDQMAQVCLFFSEALHQIVNRPNVFFPQS